MMCANATAGANAIRVAVTTAAETYLFKVFSPLLNRCLSLRVHVGIALVTGGCAAHAAMKYSHGDDAAMDGVN